jgi:hypothetical protein
MCMLWVGNLVMQPNLVSLVQNSVKVGGWFSTCTLQRTSHLIWCMCIGKLTEGNWYGFCSNAPSCVAPCWCLIFVIFPGIESLVSTKACDFCRKKRGPEYDACYF